jgi:hypothetical protein
LVPQKLTFIACQSLLLLLGLWKVNGMGLLPTRLSDWIMYERRPVSRFQTPSDPLSFSFNAGTLILTWFLNFWPSLLPLGSTRAFGYCFQCQTITIISEYALLSHGPCANLRILSQSLLLRVCHSCTFYA